MKAKIFSFIKPVPGSTVASNRIALFLEKQLNMPLCWDASVAEEPLDLLIIVNGAFAFCDVLAELGKAITTARHVVWVQNDYTIIPPKPESEAESPFRAAFRQRKMAGMPDMHWWTTIPANAKLTGGSAYINWNMLTYNMQPPDWIENARSKAERTLFYYGAFRQNRVDYFDRYFVNARVPIVISSTSKKFVERYHAPNVSVIDGIKQDFYAKLASSGIGLYIEDKRSHKEFHSPANRFYEMLSAGLPMVFQPESKEQMLQGGIDITPYIVRDRDDVVRLLRTREDIGRHQRTLWADDYIKLLKAATRKAYKKLMQEMEEEYA